MTRRGRGDVRMLREFRREYPEWEGLPNGSVFGSLAFALWRWNRAWSDLWRVLLDGLFR